MSQLRTRHPLRDMCAFADLDELFGDGDDGPPSVQPYAYEYHEFMGMAFEALGKGLKNRSLPQKPKTRRLRHRCAA